MKIRLLPRIDSKKFADFNGTYELAPARSDEFFRRRKFVCGAQWET